MNITQRRAISKGHRPVTIRPKNWADLVAIGDYGDRIADALWDMDGDEGFVAREVLLFGNTLRETAENMGMSKTHVARIRDSATAKLVEALAY